MKIWVIILSSILLYSCSNTYIGKRYVYINVGKEWDLELIFNSDSTFHLKDSYGCTRISQMGDFNIKNPSPKHKGNILYLYDTTKHSVFIDQFNKKFLSYTSNLDGKNYSSREEFYFPLVSKDSVKIIGRKLLFRGLTFNRFNGHIEDKRIDLQAKTLIKSIGKKNFIEHVGNGKNVKQAKANMKRCN